jgi:hypothetical protein
MRNFKHKLDWAEITYKLEEDSDGDYIVSWTSEDEYNEVEYTKKEVDTNIEAGFWTIVE